MDHIYNGGRCIFCDTSSLDVSIYNTDERCEERDGQPLVYSTASNEAPKQSHGLPFNDIWVLP